MPENVEKRAPEINNKKKTDSYAHKRWQFFFFFLTIVWP